MPKEKGVVARLVALVRPLLPEDWFSEAGERFRETTGKISHFTKEQHITPSEVAEEAVSLGRRRLEGEADEKRSKAAREFAAAENLNSGYPLYSSGEPSYPWTRAVGGEDRGN